MQKDFFEPDHFEKAADSSKAADASTATGMFAAVPDDRLSSSFLPDLQSAVPVRAPEQRAKPAPPSPQRPGGAMPVVREIIVRPAASPIVDKPSAKSPGVPNADSSEPGEFTRIFQSLRQPTPAIAATTGTIGDQQGREPNKSESQSFTELFNSVSDSRPHVPAEGPPLGEASPQRDDAGSGPFTEFLDSLSKPSYSREGSIEDAAGKIHPSGPSLKDAASSVPINPTPWHDVVEVQETLSKRNQQVGSFAITPQPVAAGEDAATKMFAAFSSTRGTQQPAHDFFARQASSVSSQLDSARIEADSRNEQEASRRSAIAGVNRLPRYVPVLLILNTCMILLLLILALRRF